MTVKTWFEEGPEKGRHTGQRQILRALLEERFGTLNETAQQRLEAWPTEQLTDLGRALLRAKSLAELGLEG